jgi:hypothetical protein
MDEAIAETRPKKKLVHKEEALDATGAATELHGM